MAKFRFNLAAGVPPYSVQINPGSLCLSNCTISAAGNNIEVPYNDSGLTKGVNYNLTLTITDVLGCIQTTNAVHCCPTTGGSISGTATPNASAQITYSLISIVGTHTVNWTLIGGTGASIVSSNSTQATVNVGSTVFTLRATITDCSGSRNINYVITPACTLNVSAINFTC